MVLKTGTDLLTYLTINFYSKIITFYRKDRNQKGMVAVECFWSFSFIKYDNDIFSRVFIIQILSQDLNT